MDLYPTPRRLGMLLAVAEGTVFARLGYGSNAGWNAWRNRRNRVTKTVAELERAGWVRRGRAESPSVYAWCPYELTRAGRAVLDAHTRP